MIQYFLENLWLAWLLVSLLCLVLELTNGDFFIMCFAIGGVAAAIVSAFSDSFTLQVIVFAVVSALSIFFVRPFALKCRCHYRQNGQGNRTNSSKRTRKSKGGRRFLESCCSQ